MTRVKPIELTPIGVVHTEGLEIRRIRKPIVSEVHIFKQFEDALEGIEGFSHLIILYWMHRALRPRRRLHLKPWGRGDMPSLGIFATRSSGRPNPIGLSVVRLIERDHRVLRVKGLDALDGTPAIDIKPYDPLDRIRKISVPKWWTIKFGRVKSRNL